MTFLKVIFVVTTDNNISGDFIVIGPNPGNLIAFLSTFVDNVFAHCSHLHNQEL